MCLNSGRITLGYDQIGDKLLDSRKLNVVDFISLRFYEWSLWITLWSIGESRPDKLAILLKLKLLDIGISSSISIVLINFL